ncbi:hypothetical protein BSKO_01942 [Bryopsis sp. KO-2023]|nr:hypothetical protein BSKO_01942 [Bryopsis sp. KO-2023]
MEESTRLTQRSGSITGGKDATEVPDPPVGGSDASPIAVDPLSEASYNFSLESLDYDGKGIQTSIKRVRQDYMVKLLRGALKWTVCLLVGLLTAVIAFSVNVGVENIAGFKFWVTFKIMEAGPGSSVGAYIVFTLTNCILAGLASSVVVFYGPGAAGSGIPDVKAFLNGVDMPHVLSPKTLIAKILGSVGAVSASLAVGKEGPFVHIGACLAYLLTQGKRVHSSLSNPIFNVFNDDSQLRDFVTCGAAAGVAAAFRAPVGGVLFALEEATSWWRNQILWLAFFTTAVVSVVLRSMIRHCHASNCGFFGSGGFILFNLDEGQDSYEMFELLPMLLLGVMGGLLGSAFNAINAQLTIWRKGIFLRCKPQARVYEAMGVALLTSTVAFCLPLMVNCQNCPLHSSDTCPRNSESQSGNYVQFNCHNKAQHNDMATLFFNTQDDAIRSLLSSNNNNEYSVPTLVGYFVAFFLLATLTYGVSIPSGLFVPSILCGASYGRLVGMFVTRMHPHHNIDEGTYALLGAAGFLGGASRMTVSLCVIMLELTNNMALLPLIMLVLLVAKGVGDGSGIKAIYDIHVDLKGVPFLEAQPDRFMQHITAREASAPPVVFNRFETVGHIRAILRMNPHNGFPVLSSEGGNSMLLGIVLRSNLISILGIQNADARDPDIPLRRGVAGDRDSVRLMVSSYDSEREIDLLPMVDSSHYIVDEDMPVNKVYSLFRQLGLRHVLVIPRATEVMGVITRKDLLGELLEDKFPSRSGLSVVYNPPPIDRGASGDENTRRRRVQEAPSASKGD